MKGAQYFTSKFVCHLANLDGLGGFLYLNINEEPYRISPPSKGLKCIKFDSFIEMEMDIKTMGREAHLIPIRTLQESAFTQRAIDSITLHTLKALRKGAA